ncbi:MAG: Bug family tripartite tricarboxylate transporter substrate binding protein [Lautropia sp.]
MKRRIQALAAGLFACSLNAAAADFPSRSLSIVVPFGAGGSTDLMTRALAAEMSKTLGKEVVVVNKAGAGGTLGTAEVAAAKADGHTIGMLPVGPLTTQPHLRRLPYSAASFDMVCLVYSNPQALLVRKDAGYKTVADYIADAKAHPGKLKYGSSGAGSVPHLAFVAFAQAAGIDVVHVPHKGDADNLTSLLGGHISAFITHTAFLASNDATLKGLGLMADARLESAPGLSTFKEQGMAPLSFQVWGGLAVPKGTPPAALATLEKSCETAARSAGFRSALEKLKTPGNYMGSAAFGEFVRSEYERNGKLLRDAGLKKD